jgi:hypothetical protein
VAIGKHDTVGDVTGDGSGIERATLERSRFICLDQQCSGEFRTPLSILPLMGGGVHEWCGVEVPQFLKITRLAKNCGKLKNVNM